MEDGQVVGYKKRGGAGKGMIRIDAENRQCESVDMTWGADGYQYGPHLILNKEYPRRVPYYM